MWAAKFTLAILVCILVWASPCCSEPVPLGGDAGRPIRPKSFQSADDLRTYLDQLGLYYAVAGRPRFGKRLAFNPRVTTGWSPTQGEKRYFPVDNEEQFYDRLYSSQDE